MGRQGNRIFAVVMLVALATACVPTPTPPTPTATVNPATLPPATVNAVIVTPDLSAETLAPSWTPSAIDTRLPTSTRQPSATPTRTPTRAVTATFDLTQVGTPQANGRLLVLLTKAQLEQELLTERLNVAFSSIVSTASTLTMAPREIVLTTSINNQTTEGLLTDFRFAMRNGGRTLRGDLIASETANGTQLTSTQMNAVRQMFNDVLTRLLRNAVTAAALDPDTSLVDSFVIDGNQILIVVRMARPTPTRTPTASRTPRPTLTPSATLP
jgi:hypothetical protein